MAMQISYRLQKVKTRMTELSHRRLSLSTGIEMDAYTAGDPSNPAIYFFMVSPNRIVHGGIKLGPFRTGFTVLRRTNAAIVAPPNRRTLMPILPIS
jgi:hypothetical protein